MTLKCLRKRRVPLFDLTVFLLAGLAQLLVVSEASYAALGEKRETLETDRAAEPAYKKSTEAHSSFSIRVTQGQGFTLKEYVTQSGVVFGITWTGKVPLNLSDIFGSYLTDYQQAADKAATQKRPTRLRMRVPHVLIQGSQVTFERFGQGPSTHSRAVVSQLIPAGVSANEIK